MILKDVHRYVSRYLEATGCDILERSDSHIKVKLSPTADKELTNRPFYWSFVERSNEQPETLSFCFIFDPVKYEQQKLEQQSIEQEQAKRSAEEKLAEDILERTFGTVVKPFTRVQQEHLYFGSPRLEQIFQATKQNGSYVCLYEESKGSTLHPLDSKAYTAWLGINYRVEYCSDRKREDMFSLGISLVTGYVAEHFYDKLTGIKLSAKLPSNVHIAKHAISYSKAVQLAEQYIERRLKPLDYSWAKEATIRLEEELQRIEHYYEPLLKQAVGEEVEAKIRQQYEQRKEEIRWQFEPRIQVTVTNCGLFHLEGID